MVDDRLRDEAFSDPASPMIDTLEVFLLQGDIEFSRDRQLVQIVLRILAGALAGGVVEALASEENQVDRFNSPRLHQASRRQIVFIRGTFRFKFRYDAYRNYWELSIYGLSSSTWNGPRVYRQRSPLIVDTEIFGGSVIGRAKVTMAFLLGLLLTPLVDASIQQSTAGKAAIKTGAFAIDRSIKAVEELVHNYLHGARLEQHGSNLRIVLSMAPARIAAEVQGIAADDKRRKRRKGLAKPVKRRRKKT